MGVFTQSCGGDCNPDAVINQMVEERGKFSNVIWQAIKQSSNILKFAEAVKRPFEDGMGDTITSLVLDIAQPSHTDVIGHEKRLASARPGNSPCDVPVKKIPMGSHTVTACIGAWGWETQEFCKFDLAFKHKRQEQIGQVKQIMTTWSKGIWSKWVWRAYQKSVQNWIISLNLQNQHGHAGYPLSNPTSILTIPFLDAITQRLDDNAGMIGSPMPGKWVVLIGENECLELFARYYKDGVADYGLRNSLSFYMEQHKRYDPELLGGVNTYQLGKYTFVTETHAPRYRDRVGNETWEAALLDDRIQKPSQYGTESEVPASYRNPNIAKYSETLIWNNEAVEWLTPSLGMTGDNGFNKDTKYQYSGEFIPVLKPQWNDPLQKTVKYYAEFVAGMKSIYPKRGAALLSLAVHSNPALETISYNASPDADIANYTSIQTYLPVLPLGSLQIQTKNPVPQFSDGYRLFLVSQGDKKVKISTHTSQYCEDMGYWLHTLTFVNPEAGACVPRDCDRWLKVAVLPEGTAESTLLDEAGCALCGGGGDVTPSVVTVTYQGDNIRGVKIGTTTIEGTEAEVATLEAAVQTHLDTLTDGGTVDIVAGVSGNNYTWTITITDGVAAFSVLSEADGGGLVTHNSDGTQVAPVIVFRVATNSAVAGFADYAGNYVDSGENTTSGAKPIWTNGTRFAANGNTTFGAAVMKYYITLANAKADSGSLYDSAVAGVSTVERTSDSVVVGVQS